MKARMTFGAIGALVLTVSATADVINIGWFEKAGPGDIHYQGNYAQFLSSDAEGPNNEHTRIVLDLDGLLESLGPNWGLKSVSIIDTGENIYTSSPGADIDLFRMFNVRSGVDVSYLYDGPFEYHQNETEAQWKQRVWDLDWGAGGLDGMMWLSLGDEGRLSATLSELQFANQGDAPFELHFGEAGSPESFLVEVEVMFVPTPGALALLAIAGVMMRSRKRRI